jgi:hypothetical protein
VPSRVSFRVEESQAQGIIRAAVIQQPKSAEELSGGSAQGLGGQRGELLAEVGLEERAKADTSAL